MGNNTRKNRSDAYASIYRMQEGLCAAWPIHEKDPASGRSSITAAQALVQLHKSGHMDLAKDAWKSTCFVPHHVVRNASQVFLVLLGETYAVRLWPAHLCPTGLGGLEQATASARRWVFDIAETWNWVVVTNVSEWRVIPTKWVANTHDTARFGFIAAEELRGGVAHVPVVAEALVQVRHREAKAFRKEISFLTPPSVATSSRDGVDLPGSGNPRKTQQEYELAAINTWMDGHPLREEYLTRLKALHKKQQSRCKRKADKRDCDADASESASS